MFLLVSVRHVGAHPDGYQNGVCIQISINFVKTFPRISRIRKSTKYSSDLNLGQGLCIFTSFHFPDSGLLSIERFWFLFWSILNGVTLKTSNWGIFGFTICAWVERYFCKFKMASRSWVTTHPWSRLESSYRVGQIFERIGWKCHHVFGAQIWNGLAFKFLYGWKRVWDSLPLRRS